jgi:hypothetical protein
MPCGAAPGIGAAPGDAIGCGAIAPGCRGTIGSDIGAAPGSGVPAPGMPGGE